MRCRHAQKLLSASSDGEVGGWRGGAARAHATSCPRCRSFARFLSECGRDLDLLTTPPVQPGLTDRLLACLPEPPTRGALLRRWLASSPAVAAAAAVVAFACGIAMALSMNDGQDSPAAVSTEPSDPLYTDSFDALPGESAGGNYIALLQDTEK